ncbi:hypothetical protein SALBM135S_07514 [Streptomyces alboniger]
MTACAPTDTTDSAHEPRAHKPHAPPPKKRFRIAGADFSASIAVFLIALPLSLGIALATGAPLQAGLVAAAVGGVVAGRLGGSPLQVSGPAAGLTVVTADLIQRYGWRTTCAITVLVGLAQLGLGCLRVARSALAVSPAVVHGMLAGIGVTIAVAQLHIVLGGTPQSAVVDNLRALPAQLATLHPAALSVSLLTLVVLLLAAARPAGLAAGGRRGLGAPGGRAPADPVEQLCLTNVVQQLEHLKAHESVARRLAAGDLELHGMYFHVGEAQSYLLTEGSGVERLPYEVFDQVAPTRWGPTRAAAPRP